MYALTVLVGAASGVAEGDSVGVGITVSPASMRGWMTLVGAVFVVVGPMSRVSFESGFIAFAATTAIATSKSNPTAPSPMMSPFPPP